MKAVLFTSLVMMAGHAYADQIQVGPGEAQPDSAPIKIIAGTNLTTPEPGAIEFDGTHLYFTDSQGTRHQLATEDSKGNCAAPAAK